MLDDFQATKQTFVQTAGLAVLKKLHESPWDL